MLCGATFPMETSIMKPTGGELSWAITGCGWVARDHVAPSILSAPSARLVALHDVDQGAIRGMPDAETIAWRGTSFKALLERDDIDAVYIAHAESGARRGGRGDRVGGQACLL